MYSTCSMVSIAMIFLFFTIFVQQAYAYIDPGTGSWVFQLIIAGIVGGLFAIKIFWRKIVNVLKKPFTKK